MTLPCPSVLTQPTRLSRLLPAALGLSLLAAPVAALAQATLVKGYGGPAGFGTGIGSLSGRRPAA